MKRLYLVVTTAVLLMASGSACFGQQQQNPPSGPPQQQTPQPRATDVDARPAQRGNLQASISYTGDVRAKASVSVVPRVTGRIEEMRVDIGSEVKAGDVMAVLEQASLRAALRQAQGTLQSAQARYEGLQSPRSEDIAVARANVVSAQDRLDRIVNPPAAEVDVLRAQVAKAEAALKSAQSNYDRVAFEPDAGRRPEAVALEAATNDYNIALSNLKNKQTPAQQDVDIARQAVEQAEQQFRKALQPSTESDLGVQRGTIVSAQAGVEVAQVNLSETTIKAPIDGIVADRPSPVGSIATTAAPVISLISKDVEVVIPVEETRLPQLQVGSRAFLNVAAYPGEDITGTVTSIAPTVDQRSRTVAVRVEPQNQDGRLKAGMFAQIRIITQDRRDVIVVAKDAVVQRNNQNVVFVVADGRAKLTPVQVGASNDASTEVVSGLEQGAQVIITGVATLRDGDQVTVRQQAAPGAQGGATGGQRPGATPGAQGSTTPGASATAGAGGR